MKCRDYLRKNKFACKFSFAKEQNIFRFHLINLFTK